MFSDALKHITPAIKKEPVKVKVKEKEVFETKSLKKINKNKKSNTSKTNGY